jgi:hypothetical protein
MDLTPPPPPKPTIPSAPTPEHAHAGLKGRLEQVADWCRGHSKLLTITGASVTVIALAGGVAWWKLRPASTVVREENQTTTKEAPPVKAITKASPLTGLEVSTADAERPIRAVVIENSPAARPQSGLSEAGVVYEALAEGGITRFLAFYLDTKPAVIGPVRSLRTYFVSWALEYDSPVAHVGGNADALDLVKPLGLKSITQFSHAGSYYRTKDRSSPHNMYTSTVLLDQLLAKLGYDKPATFAPFSRKDDAPPAGGAAAKPKVNITYSYRGFDVEYRYDAATNDYHRFLAGAPHIDRETGAVIRAKNVVVLFTTTSFGTTRIGEQTVIMGTTGSGRAIIFRDGGAVEGTWQKPTHRDRTKLLDTAGAELALNRGTTWFAVVPPDRRVTY